MKVVLENKAGVRVSTSTISRYFAMPSIYTSNVPSMVFKRVSHRAPNANSDENKELRIKKVIEQATAIRKGNLETYVDESAVEMTSIRNYGWAPPNVKAFDYHRRQKVTKLTAVTFISRNGVEYCQFIEGNVTEEAFRSIFQNSCTRFGDRRRVFTMDNARVDHSELVQLANASGHKLCFNAPNSPEMNPIEMIFGIWKKRSRPLIATLSNKMEIIRKLAEVFSEIPCDEVQECIIHLQDVIWAKIKRREDL